MKKAVRLLAFLLVLLGALWTSPGGMWAQTGNQAALVVRFSDERTETACVDFSEPEITGFDLIQRSGLNIAVDVQGLGALVCSIEDTGCPANDCLCQCRGGGECIYWSYWHRQPDGWQYSQAGSTSYLIQPGAVDGWSWGPGAANQAIAPPELSFADVCLAPATDTPTPSPSPSVTNTAVVIVVTQAATNTRSSVAVNTAAPATATPSATGVATAVPTAAATVTANIVASATPQPGQRASATPTLEAEPTQIAVTQQPVVAAEVTLRPTEGVVIADLGDEPPLPTPPAVEPLDSSQAAAAAVSRLVEESVEMPPTVESAPQIVVVTGEPAPQLQVVGSGVVPTVEYVDEQRVEENRSAGEPAEWVPYVVFLLIMVGLGTVLYITSRRRKGQGVS